MVDHRTVLDIRAGPRAQAQVRDRGLAPADVVCLPAAAGGPKGLGLLPLDELLHVEWLARAPRLHLVGASIGAWRAAALAGPDPPAALRRLRHAYVRDQSYPARPSPTQVSATIRGVVRRVLDGHPLAVRPGVGLDVLTSHARAGPLGQDPSRRAFASAAFANAVSRARLATHLDRVSFHLGARSALEPPFDAFGWNRVPLDADNAEDALLASGSIPLVCAPVR